MRVAAVQFKPAKGEKTASLDALAALADRAAEGADLVVLPELAATGYLFANPSASRAVAESPSRGPTFAALHTIARGRGSWLVAGFVEEAGAELYNSAIVIDDRGTLAGVYRKTLLFPADEWWATPGDSGYLA